MKKLFTLFIALSIALFSFAYNNDTRLTISSLYEISLVLIDGRSYNISQSERGFLINNLRPGYHSVKVYKRKQGFRGGQSQATLLYEGRIMSRAGYHTDIMINRFGKAFLDSRKIVYSGREEDEEEFDHNYDWNQSQAMTTASFEQLKRTLANEAFDKTRKNMLLQALNDNYFLTSQVKDLLGLFSFEETKLELAKLFYKKTTDKENYTAVYDVFSFSASKDELAKYIMTNK